MSHRVAMLEFESSPYITLIFALCLLIMLHIMIPGSSLPFPPCFLISSPIRHNRGKGIPMCFLVKDMKGKGRVLEVHTPAYPCTLTKGIGVCLHKNIV